MADADSVIAAIFAAASEDERCSPAAEGLHKLYSEGAWEAPKIVEAIRTAGTMRLTRIEITGFRGALPPLPIELNEKSFFIYGENGRGKSTISDALELWSTGKLQTFRREKCGLDAAIHVDATEATIEVLPEGSGPLKRTLRGSSVSDPKPRDDSGDPSHALGLPLLRHETVRDFIEKSPGDKKREILALVGLEGLNDFRDAIRTAKSEAKRAREEAVGMTKAEEARLSDKTTGRDTVEVAEELRVGAKLPNPITDLDELRNRDLHTAPAATTPDRPGEVEKLTRILEDALKVDLQPWNDLIADQESVTRKAVATLVREGRSVLPHWGRSRARCVSRNTRASALPPSSRSESQSSLTSRSASRRLRRRLLPRSRRGER